jgi:pimeloyl-ACP methyl ester carboxylesterase
MSRVLGQAAEVVDRALVSAMQLRNTSERARAEALPHDERIRLLEVVAEAYRSGHGDPGVFFPSPPPIAPRSSFVRALGARRPPRGELAGVYDLAWESRYEPFDAGVRDKYHSRTPNRTAHARVYLAGPPRPAIVLVHGYMGGQWALEERQWPIGWFFKRGLDVVVPVLPFHARRGDGGPPWLPSSDPRVTNEGFRQAMHDIRGLVGWLRARGAPAVGAMGMSLGGYTSSLLATVERELAFVAPMIPLASVADFARDQGRLGEGAGAEAQHAALERANWVVSPLARPLLVPTERTVVLAAASDRITPLAHAERIGAHFGVPVTTFSGGHLLQVGRGDAFRAVGRMLEAAGIMSRRPE